MHLALGRRFFQEGGFPQGDPFLYPSPAIPANWLSHWGAHLGAYLLYKMGGWDALVIAKTVLVLLGAGAPLWVAWRLGYRSVLIPALIFIALWAGCDRFLERASLFSDVCGAWVLAICCVEIVHPSRWRWLLPLIFLIWNNIHPGVSPGLGFVGAAMLVHPREWRRWVPLFVACLIALCIHPTGPKNFLWPILAMLAKDHEIISKFYYEFMPTFSERYRATFQVWVFLALLGITGVIVLCSWFRKVSPWYALLCLGAVAYLGISAIRFVTTAAFALSVLAVAVSARARLGQGADCGAPDTARRALVLAQGGVLVVGLVLCIKLAGWGYTTQSGPRYLGIGLDLDMLPIKAAEFARTLPRATRIFNEQVKAAELTGKLPRATRIFNEHALGAFLAWEWDGDPRVHYHGYAMDAQFYDRDYQGVNKSPQEFQRVVDTYDIGAFLLQRIPVSPTSGPLFHRLLLTLPEWRLVFWDQRVMVFLRDRPDHREILERNEYRYLDPFRPSRVDRGIRENPGRLYEEALRALDADPTNPMARKVLAKLYHQNPDELLRKRQGGAANGASLRMGRISNNSG